MVGPINASLRNEEFGRYGYILKLGDASVRGLRGALRRQTLTQSILHRGLPGRRCAGYSGSPAASSARKILRPLRWRTHTPSPDCVVSFRARPDPNKLANSLQAECHRGDSTICFSVTASADSSSRVSSHCPPLLSYPGAGTSGNFLLKAGLRKI
jgi:hypothetical protein